MSVFALPGITPCPLYCNLLPLFTRMSEQRWLKNIAFFQILLKFIYVDLKVEFINVMPFQGCD